MRVGGLSVSRVRKGTADLMGDIIKERPRIGVLTPLATVLVLIWSVIGGAPAAAQAGSRVVADWPIVDARCPPVTPEGLVGYGCTKLSTYLQRARLDLRYNRPPKTTDKLYTNVKGNYAIAQLQDGKYIIGYSGSGKNHAEIRLLAQSEGKAPRIEFDPQTGKVSYQPAKASPIKEGYSEIEPCKKTCNPALEAAKVRDKFTYSYRWNPGPGETTQEVHDKTNHAKTGAKQVAVRTLLNETKAAGPILPKSPEELAKGSAVSKAVGKQLGPVRPGGIDFSSVQLRYVTDGGSSGDTYSFETSTTPGQESKDGTDQIYDADEALNTWMAVEPSRFWVNLNPSQPDKVIQTSTSARPRSVSSCRGRPGVEAGLDAIPGPEDARRAGVLGPDDRPGRGLHPAVDRAAGGDDPRGGEPPLHSRRAA